MALQSNTDLRLLNGLLQVSSVFFLPLFVVYNFASVTIFLYTVSPSVFGRLLIVLPRGLWLNTLLTFLLLSILLTWPMEFNRIILTNGSISKSPQNCISSLYLVAEFLRYQTTGRQLIGWFIPQAAIIQSNAPDDGRNCCPKHVELIWIY